MSMAVLDYVLNEELSRLGRYKAHLEENVQSLPKGSVSIKIKSKHPYAYLSAREGKRVVSKYLGPADDPRVAEIVQRVESRRRAVAEIRAVKADIARINRMLHA